MGWHREAHSPVGRRPAVESIRSHIARATYGIRTGETRTAQVDWVILKVSEDVKSYEKGTPSPFFRAIQCMLTRPTGGRYSCNVAHAFPRPRGCDIHPARHQRRRVQRVYCLLYRACVSRPLIGFQDALYRLMADWRWGPVPRRYSRGSLP